MLFITQCSSQIFDQSFTLSRFIKERISGEFLKGATVKDINSNLTAVINNYGFFSISLIKGAHTIQISAGDYESHTRALTINKDLEWNAFLYPQTYELEQVALVDGYFKARNLFPNVDFYSGIINKAPGIPTDMFTVIFAIGRLPGWIAQ